MKAVILPYSGNPLREKQYQWVKRYYETYFPFEVVTGSCEGRWRKGVAIADALAKTDAQTLYIIDADIILPFVDVEPDGLVIPFNRCYNLTQSATERLYDCGVGIPSGLPLEKVRERFRWAGGVWIIDRALYELLPVDSRFEGWGGEDESFCLAIATLHSPLTMLDGDVWHLWHEPQPEKIKFKRTHNWTLLKAYRSAKRRPERMAEVVKAAVKHTYPNV